MRPAGSILVALGAQSYRLASLFLPTRMVTLFHIDTYGCATSAVTTPVTNSLKAGRLSQFNHRSIESSRSVEHSSAKKKLNSGFAKLREYSTTIFNDLPSPRSVSTSIHSQPDNRSLLARIQRMELPPESIPSPSTSVAIRCGFGSIRRRFPQPPINTNRHSFHQSTAVNSVEDIRSSEDHSERSEFFVNI